MYIVKGNGIREGFNTYGEALKGWLYHVGLGRKVEITNYEEDKASVEVFMYLLENGLI